MKLPGEPQSIYLGCLVVLSIEILQKEHLTSFQPQGNLERGIKRISQVTKKENTNEISNLNNKLIMHINIQPKDKGNCNERDTLCLTHILYFLVRHHKYILKGSSIAVNQWEWYSMLVSGFDYKVPNHDSQCVILANSLWVFTF